MGNSNQNSFGYIVNKNDNKGLKESVELASLEGKIRTEEIYNDNTDETENVYWPLKPIVEFPEDWELADKEQVLKEALFHQNSNGFQSDNCFELYSEIKGVTYRWFVSQTGIKQTVSYFSFDGIW